MFTLIRTIGGGPKNRLKQDGYNLDLTYITPRVIAMSFSSSGLESIYRNDLQEIVQFLHKRHGQNYMIINVSNRKYQYQRFHGEIKDYFWPNHQTPELKTLFEICHHVTEFLSKNEKNVVAFHCNHGKGRTGTSIISFLLYSGFYQNLESGVQIYNEKRFSHSFYQINIPCQMRYLQYFESILADGKVDFKKLTPLRLTSIETKGVKNSDDLFLRLSYVKDQQAIGSDIRLLKKVTYVDMKELLIGDIKAEIYAEKILFGKSKIGYMNFHTYFAQKFKEEYQTKQLTSERKYSQHRKMTFHSRNIKISWGYSDIQLTFVFQEVNGEKMNKEAKQLGQLSQTNISVNQRLQKERDNFEVIEKIVKLREKPGNFK